MRTLTLRKRMMKRNKCRPFDARRTVTESKRAFFIKLKLLNSAVLPGLSECCKNVHLKRCLPCTRAMVMSEAANGCFYFQWTVWKAVLIQVTNVARTSGASILKVPKEIVLDGTSRNYEFSLKWKRSEDMLIKNPKAELRGRITQQHDCQCAFFVDAHLPATAYLN